MRKKIIIWTIVAFITLYIFFPVIAGLLQVGRVDGPRIYFAGHHKCLYELAFEQRFDYTPRPSIWHKRPLFYGMTPELREVSEEMKKKWDEIPQDQKPKY